MPTGTQIITRAVTVLNLIDDGGSISASELSGLLVELNAMVNAWATENTLVPSVATAQFPLQAGANPYFMGPLTNGFSGSALLGASTPITSATNANPGVLTRAAHGLVSGQLIYISGFTGNWTPYNNTVRVVTLLSSSTFSVPVDSTTFGAVTGTPVFQLVTTDAIGTPSVTRPVRIEQAFQVATVGSGTNRNALAIVGSRQYFEHNDLSASATSSDEVYVEYSDASGLLKVYFFPVSSCPTPSFFEAETWNPIAAFALAVNQPLAFGYEDALVYGLAFRCIPRYGAVINQDVAAAVTAIGKQAKDRVKELNVQNRLLDPALLQSVQPAAEK